MKVRSVNVSQPRIVEIKGQPVRTGIYKEPVAGPVWIHKLLLDGDGQADLENHGGVDKAAYAYPWEHYAHWAGELQRADFVHGQFGENFTVEGLLETEVCIGDQLRLGDTVVEVSQPRVPCFKLAHKMGLPDFPKRFLASRLTGFYLRIIEEGEVKAGDAITWVKRDPARVSVHEVVQVFFFDRENIELARRVLAVPALTPSWHEDLEKRVAAIG